MGEAGTLSEDLGEGLELRLAFSSGDGNDGESGHFMEEVMRNRSEPRYEKAFEIGVEGMPGRFRRGGGLGGAEEAIVDYAEVGEVGKIV